MAGNVCVRFYMLLGMMTNAVAFPFGQKDIIFASAYNYSLNIYHILYSEISPDDGNSQANFKLLYNGLGSFGFRGGLVYDSANCTLYWSDNEEKTVEKYDLESQSHGIVFSFSVPDYYSWMAIDPIERIMYLSGPKQIDYFRIDVGLDISTFMKIEENINEVVVDAANRYLYMVISSFQVDDYIQRVSLDDPGAVNLLISGDHILGLAISPNKIYWLASSLVQEADLDGSNIKALNITHESLNTVSWIEAYNHSLLGINDLEGIVYRMDINSGEVVTWSPLGYYIDRICKQEGSENLGLSTGVTEDDQQSSTVHWSLSTVDLHVTAPKDIDMTTVRDGESSTAPWGSTVPRGMSTVDLSESSEASSLVPVYVIVVVAILCVIILLAIPALIFFSRFYYRHKSKKADAAVCDDVPEDQTQLADEGYEVPMATVIHNYAQPVASDTEVDKQSDEDAHSYISIIG